MIHGPGSSIYIFASLEWTAGRAIPFQPRSSTRYLTVETAICKTNYEKPCIRMRGTLTPSIAGYREKKRIFPVGARATCGGVKKLNE